MPDEFQDVVDASRLIANAKQKSGRESPDRSDGDTAFVEQMVRQLRAHENALDKAGGSPLDHLPERV